MDRKDININLGLNLPPIRDIRTIPFRSLLRVAKLPTLPDNYNVDDGLNVVDDNMFGNDEYGDCVKAAMAHQSLRFEKFEQGVLLPITSDEVIDDYLRETGGFDIGLYLHLAMKDWRKTGLTFGGKNYKIHAFADVNPLDLAQVRYSILLLRGLIFGMSVYSADIDQFHNGEMWHLTDNSGSLEGGHGVYAYKYSTGSTDTFECMTWGVRQPMTVDFWNARVNQAYAIVDSVNPWMSDDSPLDVNRMEKQLYEITGEPSNNNTCCLCKLVKKILKNA